MREKRGEKREEKRREEKRREEKREIERKCKMRRCNENVRIISISFLEEPYAQALSGKNHRPWADWMGEPKIAR